MDHEPGCSPVTDDILSITPAIMAFTKSRSIHVALHPSIHPPTHPPVHPSAHSAVHPSALSAVHPSARPAVRMSRSPGHRPAAPAVATPAEWGLANRLVFIARRIRLGYTKLKVKRQWKWIGHRGIPCGRTAEHSSGRAVDRSGSRGSRGGSRGGVTGPAHGSRTGASPGMWRWLDANRRPRASEAWMCALN
jgi:hypothetical protein